MGARVSRLEGREAGAKHQAEGEPVRWRPVGARPRKNKIKSFKVLFSV